MNNLNKLVDELKKSPLVKRYKELETIIDNDENLKKEYNKLLDLQKDMVNKRERYPKLFDEAKAKYDQQKEKVMSFLILEEYLDLQLEINEDLQMIQSIITEELNQDIGK